MTMASNIGDTESTVTPTFVNESFIVAHPSTVGNTVGENDTVYYCDLVFRTIRKSISLLNIVIELLKLGMILAEIYVVCGFCNFAIYSMRL